MRQEFPQLHRTTWFSGRKQPGQTVDILWLHPGGHEMTVADWNDSARHAFGFLLGAETGQETPLLCLINAELDAKDFALPPGSWVLRMDSSAAGQETSAGAAFAGSIELSALSLVLLSELLSDRQAERNKHAFPA